MSRRFKKHIRRWFAKILPVPGFVAPEQLVGNLYTSYIVADPTTIVLSGRVFAMTERMGRGDDFLMQPTGASGGPLFEQEDAVLGQPVMWQGTDESCGLSSVSALAPMTNGSGQHGAYIVGTHVPLNSTKAIVGALGVDSYIGSTPANHGIVYTNGRAAQDNQAMGNQGFALFVDMDGSHIDATVHYMDGSVHSWSTTGGPEAVWLGLTMMTRAANANPWPGALAECGFTTGPFSPEDKDALLTKRLRPLYGFA